MLKCSLVSQVIVDGFQNARRQLMLLQQVSEIHDCRVFGDWGAERQTSKLPHRSDLVQCFFHGWVAQREPVLQQVNAQHGFQWVWLATTARLWVMRLNNATKPLRGTTCSISARKRSRRVCLRLPAYSKSEKLTASGHDYASGCFSVISRALNGLR